jgi:DNA-binding response OmpR family regulator
MISVLVVGAGNKTVYSGLEKRYTLLNAVSGKMALAMLDEQTPDVIVVDAASMRTSGLWLCRDLRRRLPHVLMIHIHPLPKQQVDTPADVLLFPHFTARKLINNIERLLKTRSGDVIECGPFSINVKSRILSAHGQEIQLTPKLARLMETFLRNPGRTIDRKTLMDRVWDTNYMGDTRTLDVHIRWIREAIENHSKPRYLKTVRGVGYRLEIPEEK